METTRNAGRQLREHLDARNKHTSGHAAANYDRIAHLYRLILETGLSQWEALLAEKTSAA